MTHVVYKKRQGCIKYNMISLKGLVCIVLCKCYCNIFTTRLLENCRKPLPMSCECREKALPSSDSVYKIVPVTAATWHAEGPHWDPRKQALYYVNTFSPTVFRLKDGILTHQQIGKAHSIGTVTPIDGTENKFLITCDKAVWVLTWDGETNNSGFVDYSESIIDDLEPDKPRNQANDGKADSLGRLWLGTLTRNLDLTVTEPGGSLFIIDENGAAKVLLDSLTISNGIAWSKDEKRFFFVDSAVKDIKVFDCNVQNGTISNPKILFQLDNLSDISPSGIIDGITIDSNDNLWIAIYRGGLVFQVDGKNGAVLKKIEMPVSGVTSLAFGGPNFDVLYATTSRHGLSKEALEKQPESGKVFAITGLGVKGTPMNNYALKGKCSK
ncbi:regucalcin-like [Agrilus planipennis]|uniref:Regucalcin n=1 Tax=Agrilus planipennis TaxID=224129 RepID=A0A1W4WTF3_AGRPL|nr:regucalcin-like [Agrilus planipennis]